METLPGPLEGIIQVNNIHEIVFTSITLPRGPLLKYFLPIFVYHYFFVFLFFWRTFRLLHANFFTDVFGITQMVNALKKPFRNISTSAGRHFDVFWELSPIKKFCTDVFFITLTVIVLKKLHSTYLFAEGIKQYFWTYFKYIPQCLEKLKTFSWCFGRISTYYCGGQ